ncbi:D-glucuronyl C5-epimerase family protein [Candidatus Solirubrobacter pratensis]|uniref:D-glucuronyl C5-epimerase family protein n=1 Tax=Candidatus Solirubrobacter pratensis TaxID=1298857 RepID=UPI0012DDC943|nr:D-glucuronyl C5-epimerase family protein [Candidatus Solirubrobacter pratensis]
MRRLALVALALLAGCAPPAARPAPTPLAPVPAVPDDRGARDVAYANARRAQAEAAARLRAAIAQARRSPTVFGALRAARLTGRITPAAEARLRGDWARANATLWTLAGVRRSELAYVIGAVSSLAAQRALTAGRIAPAFLILRTNTTFWARAPMPASGYRTTFGRDPAIFQYYPGHGMQLQPLASWGKANALAGACLKALRTGSRKHPCRHAALTATLDRLSALAATRSGYTAWEYYFAYGTGTPPWVSGMTQATAAQALARGYRALGEERWRRTALRALGAFEQPPPLGVSVPAPGGNQYLLYSFAPGYRVINADLQAVLGLRDTATLTHSAVARRLFRRGDRAARRAVAGFDTGAWSLYSARGAESTLDYHVLTASFLKGLCERLQAKVYCRTGARFKRYEKEPTKIAVAPVRKPRAFSATRLAFTLSKISAVKVTVRGTRGLGFSRELQLPRGRHMLAWNPPGRGRYRLRIEARGPSGPAGVVQTTIRVTRPMPRHKKKHGRHHDDAKRRAANTA